MRLHRFYSPTQIGADAYVTVRSADLVHQIRRVFRMKEGDHIILFNGTGFDYECKIDGFGDGSKISSNNCIRLHVISTKRSRINPQHKIFLCASVIKKDKFEWIVEKATELGVTDIVPVVSHRSEKKSLNRTRLEKISVEASEQCGRGTIPMIYPVMGVADVAAFLEKEHGREGEVNKLAFHTEGERFGGGRASKIFREESDLAIFIGPEGGWSDEEIAMFHRQGIRILTLGDQILRAETAAVSALSLLMFGE